MNRRCIGLKVKSSAESLLAEKRDLYVYILMFINIDLINLKKEAIFISHCYIYQKPLLRI